MGAGKKSIKEDPLQPSKARVGFIEFKTKEKSKKTKVKSTPNSKLNP
jgi:hypothetical protein